MSWTAHPAAQYSGGTMEEALAGMAKIGAPRKPVGTSVPTDAFNASGNPTTATRPKGSKASGGATGTQANRSPVGTEHLGAACAIRVNYKAVVPVESGPTQMKGRLFPSSTVRGSFKGASGY